MQPKSSQTIFTWQLQDELPELQAPHDTWSNCPVRCDVLLPGAGIGMLLIIMADVLGAGIGLLSSFFVLMSGS